MARPFVAEMQELWAFCRGTDDDLLQATQSLQGPVRPGGSPDFARGFR